MGSQMTVGRRIGLGFTLVIVIAMVIGGLGVWNMRSATTDSTKLATEYVPEVKVATALRGAANRVMYEMRGYGLTDDRTYYEAAKEDLAEVDKHLAEARKLAQSAAHLEALDGHVKEATGAVAKYTELVEQTVAANAKIEKDRHELEEAATEYMENAFALLAHQNEMMKESLGGGEETGHGAGNGPHHATSGQHGSTSYAGSVAARLCPEGDRVIDVLRQGNSRYVEGALANPRSDQGRRTETATKGQHPRVTVLACSDSRVPVETLFDQGVGDVFPIRVAGNVCAVDELGSIEYGVDHLETPLLVVLGHTSCGAVTAVATDAAVHGSIPALLENIQPPVAKVRDTHPSLHGKELVNASVVENVWHSIEQVLTKSSAVQERAKAGKVKVVGAVYDIEHGTVEWLGVHPRQSQLLAMAVTEPSHGTAHASAGADKDNTKRLERLEQITLINDIIDLGNATQIACAKSQALRDPKLIEDGNKNFEAMAGKFASLRNITRLKEDLEHIDKIEEGATHYKTAMNDLLKNWLALQNLGTQREETGRHVIEVCTMTADAGMTSTDQIATTAAASLSRNSTIMMFGLVIGTIIGIVSAVKITRSITGPLTRIIVNLNEGADQVNDAAGQVSSASQQLAEGASEQASSLEETSASLEQMAAMTRTNAENSKEANVLSSQARSAAQDGDKTMDQLNGAMTAINDSSAQISKIIKVIEEIAFQTNLLALNAAVEAARAGEHGKGFAVVADEVRNLAQRCAQAARETTGLIEDSVNKAKEGADVAGEVGKALAAIVGDVTKVTDLIDGIAQASQEQAQGVDQVNTAVSQMDKVTQQNASGAEESASAAEELSAQAQSVKGVVDELSALVSGRQSNGSVATTARRAHAGTPERQVEVNATHLNRQPASTPAHARNAGQNPGANAGFSNEYSSMDDKELTGF